jgi:hypothetical protein
MTPRNASSDAEVSLESGTFDIREFTRTARGNLRSELKLDEIAASGLGADAVRLLRLLRDLERSTMQRMRNLLVTATHKDARVTAFLTTWAFEKFWIADALDAVLEAVGADTAALEGPRRRSLSERAERRGPVRRAIAGNFAGTQLVAAHVTTGLIDEWISQAAYRRLGEAASVLSDLVTRLLALKDRHIAFLSEDAERRLAAGGRAVKLTRTAIAQAAWPIGATEIPDADRTFFETFVFGGTEGRTAAARIAERIAALPGLTSAQGDTVAARLAS